MTTRIWIEPVKRPDGRNWYTDRGLLLRTRFGGPDGEVLCDRVHNATSETCRVLMSRGIVGSFETWKVGIGYPCMTGDIASTAELTVREPEDGIVHFARWRPFDRDAIFRFAVSATACKSDWGEGVVADASAPVRSGPRGTSRRRRDHALGPDLCARWLIVMPA
jgi:hypothetical protein